VQTELKYLSECSSSPEPEIGDVIEIEYSGEILETYPARIADVYGIKVIKETITISCTKIGLIVNAGLLISINLGCDFSIHNTTGYKGNRNMGLNPYGYGERDTVS